MAKKKKTVTEAQCLAEVERAKKLLLADVERAQEIVQKELEPQLKKIEKDIIGVLGFGAAKKKGRR